MKYKDFTTKYRDQLTWTGFCVSAAVFCPSAHAAPDNIQGYVMHVQMTPAVCALDSSKRKQRKCLEGYALTISSLQPETTDRECSTKSSASLTPLQAKVVARVMPDNNARVQLWESIGGCVPMDASRYFRTVINFAERLKVPEDLTSSVTVETRQQVLRQQFQKLNPSLPGNGIHFSCQSLRREAILTEVKVCYSTNGKYKQCASHVVTNCPEDIVIKGSY